jgi:phage terminase large subunit GpA-like protein
MDTMSAGSGFREGWLKKGVQLGGSATGENFIGAAVCTAAGSILMVFPTIEDAKQWELQRFEPMRLATRALRRRVKDSDSKKADNTKLRKKYPGGVMRLVSAKRPRQRLENEHDRGQSLLPIEHQKR